VAGRVASKVHAIFPCPIAASGLIPQPSRIISITGPLIARNLPTGKTRQRFPMAAGMTMRYRLIHIAPLK